MADRLRPRFNVPPAPHSRSFGAFVAIARARLPFRRRNDLAPAIAATGAGLTLIGLLTLGGSPGLGAILVACGLALAVAGGVRALNAAPGRDRNREDRVARLLRQLDRSRSLQGLEAAVPPGSLQMLETAAQYWERVENTLATHAWRNQGDLTGSVAETAHRTMLRLAVLECDPGADGLGYADAQAESRRLLLLFSQLADRAEAVAGVLDAYPRANFDGNGAPLSPAVPEIQVLNETLESLAA